MKENDNLPWLIIALLAGLTLLWNSENQDNLRTLQNSLNACKAEFATFKDGVTYGR